MVGVLGSVNLESLVRAIVPVALGRVIVLFPPLADPLRVVLAPVTPSCIEPVPRVSIAPPPFEVLIFPPLLP